MFTQPKPRRPRAFQPTAAPLEARVVLSSFKFPAAMGPAQTLGYTGKFVLTSRTYADVMHSIDRAIKAFANQFARAFEQTKGDYAKLDVLLGSVASGAAAGYNKGLLGQIDRIMQKAESRIPYGLGRHPSISGGVGLSERTASSSDSNSYATSVAALLDGAVSSAAGLTSVKDVRRAIEQVRQDVLNMAGKGKLAAHTNPVSGKVQGILASYVAIHGPGGLKQFGLRNT